MLDLKDQIIKFENKIPIRYFNYNCLDLLLENAPIQVFYNYFLSMIQYKLKNIWNHIILKWIQSKKKLNENKSFKKSIYYNQKYSFIHDNIDDSKFNELLNDFIDKDIFKSVFIIKCINCL